MAGDLLAGEEKYPDMIYVKRTYRHDGEISLEAQADMKELAIRDGVHTVGMYRWVGVRRIVNRTHLEDCSDG